MLGAFEPPPPKQPVVVPKSLPLPPKEAAPCPSAHPPATNSPPTPLALLPTPYRSFIGLGGFAGPGIFLQVVGGPVLLLGFIPSHRLSQMHIELAGSWALHTSHTAQVHSIPLDGSLCWVPGVVRFCSGVSTTIFSSNQSAKQDESIFLFGANLRVGTELFHRGPFAIRADIFGRVTFAPPHFGQALGVIDEPDAIAGGVAVIGMRAFD